MSELEALAKVVGSRRYARDLLEGAATITKPWWYGSADADDYVAYVTIRDETTAFRAATLPGERRLPK